jgi:hypothetical protein
MLNYEDVKRWKRDMMLADPEFLTGRGRLESVEFHTAERVYLAGVEDGLKAAGLPDDEIKRIINFT